MKEYNNYLFDLYGTLVDVHTDEDKDFLWQRLSLLLGADKVYCTPECLKKKYAGEIASREALAKQQRGQWAEIDIAPVFAAMYADYGVNASDEQIAQLAKIFRVLSIEKLRLFPETEQMLQRLKAAGKKVYLLSNAQQLFTMPELHALNLVPYFDGIIISSNEGLKKPSTDLYHLALKRYDLDPEQTVMVGNDDQADCWGAAKAGLDSMYVYTEQSPQRTTPLPGNCRLLSTIGDVF